MEAQEEVTLREASTPSADSAMMRKTGRRRATMTEQEATAVVPAHGLADSGTPINHLTVIFYL
jgi:hypothetical protein